MLRENAKEIGDGRESRKRVADFTATILPTLELQTNVHSANSRIPSYIEFLIKSLCDISNASDVEILERWRNFTSIRCRSELADESSTRRYECNVRNRTAKCTALVNFFKSWLESRLPCDLSGYYLKLSPFALFIAWFTLHPMIWVYVAISSESSPT